MAGAGLDALPEPAHWLHAGLVHRVVSRLRAAPASAWDSLLATIPEALVLRYGVWFLDVKPSSFSDLRSVPRECYQNAAEACLTGKAETYVEGMAAPFDGHFVTGHAWVLRNGQAVDSTWEDTDAPYLGIPFDTEVLRDIVLSVEAYGSLLSHHRSGFRPIVSINSGFDVIAPRWRDAVRQANAVWPRTLDTLLDLSRVSAGSRAHS